MWLGEDVLVQETSYERWFFAGRARLSGLTSEIKEVSIRAAKGTKAGADSMIVR